MSMDLTLALCSCSRKGIVVGKLSHPALPQLALSGSRVRLALTTPQLWVVGGIEVTSLPGLPLPFQDSVLR